MKTRELNWFNCRNGRDKSRSIRRTMAAMKKMVYDFRPPMAGTIHLIFKNQFDRIEIARLYPYGGSFIYLHALGGLQEYDYNSDGCAGRHFWRWLEEWQWPKVITQYKMTAQSIKNSIDDAPIFNPYVKNLFEAMFGIKYD